MPRAPVLSMFVVAAMGCGGGSAASHDQLLAELRTAINTPVDTPDESAQHSQLAERAAEADALQNMTRAEVEAAIGKGEDCSAHPRCAEEGFAANDWYYTVGQQGTGPAGNLPTLIVGFDRSGHVERVWNFRTH